MSHAITSAKISDDRRYELQFYALVILRDKGYKPKVEVKEPTVKEKIDAYFER